MKNVNVFKCFVASPGDTLGEREISIKVFQELNKTIGVQLSFIIEPLTWEQDSRPSFRSGYSQEAISKQLGSDYDVFIGIMSKKFGTPTPKAGSGTEEEFDNAYDRIINNDDIEIMFYFNEEPPAKMSDLNLDEIKKVHDFKKKIGNLGGYYFNYHGVADFESKLRNHLTRFFMDKFEATSQPEDVEKKKDVDVIGKLLNQRLEESLCIFTNQPIIWVNPVISKTNEISQNADENFTNSVTIEELISNPTSTIIKSPPQFGLTSLSHYLIKKAWESKSFWVYLDASEIKPHKIERIVKSQAEGFGLSISDIKCIILDSWKVSEYLGMKKLKTLCEIFPDIPVYVMQTIEDSKFFDNKENSKLNREFNVLHLLALSRTLIRKVVNEYNKKKLIGEDEIILTKILGDLDSLNMHRTPHNCLTLLKVSEKHFDESPVNRTNMLEMVLFVLFNIDSIPTYKSKPDLKDCEYVLGRFCEELIREEKYEFSRDYFMNTLEVFCKEKLMGLEVEVVFDILTANSIIIKREFNFAFKSSFWIFYFAAKRMHMDSKFADYIFTSKKYILFPELIEFYTGIDRNRSDALKILLEDIRETCNVVFDKIGIPDNFNPYFHAKWQPTDEQLEKVQHEIGENVLDSNLPESVKDQYADRSYNQLKPYNQDIHTIFEEYSLYTLMQKIKATSRALRNSDYVEPELKKEILQEIMRGWEQISKILFVLSPILAVKGRANFDDVSFLLSDNFGDDIEERINKILQVISTNIVGFFKNDLFSNKLGPLLFTHLESEKGALKKHQIALLIVLERPKDWKKNIEEYIISLSKNSYYLYDLFNVLRSRYRFDFLTSSEIKEFQYLIKKIGAKHLFGDNNPGLDKVAKVSNSVLPKRESQ